MIYVTKVLCVFILAICCRNTAAAGLGNPCENSDDCSPVNQICKSKTCTCLDGYVPSPDNINCLPAVKHDEPCEESIQCSYSNETACENGICQCKSSLQYNGERCVGKLNLGETCTDDFQCVVPFDPKQETVWCHGGQCVCRPGFTKVEDRCGTCCLHLQGRSCESGKTPLHCRSHCFYPKDGDDRFLKNAVIGGDCENDSGCSHLANSFCNNRMRQRSNCTCKDSYLAVANNTKCLLIVHHLGEGCEYDAQCSSELGQTQCEHNQCQCADGATLNKETNTCSAAVNNVISLSCFMLIWLVKLV